MRLLLADDDRPTRIMLKRSIEKFGYQVIEAEDGESAWQCLNTPPIPRIALLDWMMPGMEGVEICRKLSKRTEGSLIYTILLTMKNTKEDIVEALDKGAHDFLSKPVNINELRSRIAVGARLLQAEDKLKESQRRLATLISNVPGVVYRRRNDDTFSMDFVSEGSSTLTGFPPEAFTNGNPVSYYHLIHEEDRDKVVAGINQAISTQRPFQITYRIQTCDQQERWVWEQGRWIGNAPDGCPLLEGLITDITPQKRLEDQLIETQKMEAIARLAGGIAHDFNNFFMVIRFYADDLLNHMDPKDRHFNDIKTIWEVGEKASALSRRLLMFGQQNKKAQEWIDLAPLIPELRRLFVPLLGEGIELDMQEEGMASSILLGTGQLEQVLMNLVLNSRDALPNGGWIAIRFEQVNLDDAPDVAHLSPGSYVKITVQDNGVGMDEETLHRIYEPFYSQKDVGNESGLGLSIVYGIVRQSNGSIHVESQPNKGTTVTLFFPCKENHVLAEKNNEIHSM